MDSRALLQASGLHRRFGPLHAVNGVSLQLGRDEVVGLLGPNGAGKTTTLRMLTGTLAPSQGSVNIHGHDLAAAPLRAKRHLGYLPEQPPLFPELSVRAYLEYCTALHRVPRRRRRRAIDQALQRCQLDTVAGRVVGNLSKGYQQRLGLAQSVVHEPDVVVLDEPTVALDPNQVREARELIRFLAKGRAVLLSSHILSEVQALCDRVLIMAAGSIVHEASIGEAGPRNAWRARFARAPDEAQLRRLPFQEARRIDERTFEFHGAPESALDGLLQLSVQHGWGLRELIASGESLEEVFVRVTCGEQRTADS